VIIAGGLTVHFSQDCYGGAVIFHTTESEYCTQSSCYLEG